MSVKTTVSETLCPISRAEAVVGDRWTVLVLRELFMGSHRLMTSRRRPAVRRKWSRRA